MTAARSLGCIAAGLMLTALAGCGGGGDGIECTATPAPSITSYPPTAATVGLQYRYYVEAQFACFPFVCNSIDGVQLPPGAVIDEFYDSITWTPSQGYANTDVPFVIATEPDSCGNRARQSWTVHVSPDATPPSVTNAYPVGTNVPVTSNIGASFSEPVNPQTVTAASFLVTGLSGPIAGNVQASGSTVTFAPTADLPDSSTITVTMTTEVRDLFGNALASNYSWTFSTGVAADGFPPTVPDGLSATRVTASEVDLSWKASFDDVGVAGYKIYRDGAYVKSVTNFVVSFWTSDTGLNFNSAYSYTISAFDWSGNESGQSGSIGVITQDFQPGNVAIWGRAYHFQDGTYWARAVPDVAVVCSGYCVALDGVTAISLGGDQNLAVSNGTV